MEPADALQLSLQWHPGSVRQECDAVLVAFPAPDDDLVGGEVDVLHAQPRALEEAEASAVQQEGHELRGAVEPLEDRANLGAR